MCKYNGSGNIMLTLVILSLSLWLVWNPIYIQLPYYVISLLCLRLFWIFSSVLAPYTERDDDQTNRSTCGNLRNITTTSKHMNCFITCYVHSWCLLAGIIFYLWHTIIVLRGSRLLYSKQSAYSSGIHY